MPQPMLEVKNLAKSFGSTEVLRAYRSLSAKERRLS